MEDQDQLDNKEVVFQKFSTPVTVPEQIEEKEHLPVHSLASEPSKASFSYSSLILPILAIVSLLGFGLMIFSGSKKSQNISQALVFSPIPISTPAAIVESSPEPTVSPLPLPSVKPSPSPKPSVSPTIKPSLNP